MNQPFPSVRSLQKGALQGAFTNLGNMMSAPAALSWWRSQASETQR
jgi:hypothetical protein